MSSLLAHLTPARTFYGRSGGSTGIDLSDSLRGRENRLKRVRDQLNRDRETVTVIGADPKFWAWLEAGKIIPRLVTAEELKALNKGR